MDDEKIPGEYLEKNAMRCSSWLAELIIIAIISVFGAILRFKLGIMEPITPDEMGSLLRSLSGLGPAIFSYDLKYNPPFHQAVISTVLEFGGTVGMARMVFSATGALLIPAVFLMARRFFSPAAAILLSLLVSFNPLMIWTGYLMRGMAPACLFTVLSVYFLYDVLRSGKNHYHFLTFSALAVYSHYYTAMVMLFIAMHIYREKIRMPRNYIRTAVIVFMPAALIILWGFTIRNADFPMTLSIMDKERELLGIVTYYFIPMKPLLFVVLMVVSLVMWQKERLFRNVWGMSLLASVAVNTVFRIHDYYMCPIFIFGWAQICSVVVPEQKSPVKYVVLALIVILAFNFYTGHVNNGAENGPFQVEAREQLLQIENSGVANVFIEYDADLPFFYGLTMGHPTLGGLGKSDLLRDRIFENTRTLHGMANTKMGVKFLAFISQDHLREFVEQEALPVVIVRNRRVVESEQKADVSGCTLLLNNPVYESYLCHVGEL